MSVEAHELKLTPEWFKGKKVVVMGLGLHGGGVWTTIWLMRHGAQVTVTDSYDQHKLAPSLTQVEKAYISAQRELARDQVHRIRYVLGGYHEEDFVGIDMLIKNPFIANDNPFVVISREAGIPIENDVSLFAAMCPLPIIAVTGTRGKTTTTTLLGQIAKLHDRRSVVGGNIRIPVLSFLDDLRAKKYSAKKKPFVVLELSSWQLEALEQHRMSPHVGVITNVFPDHLNRYRDIEHYAMAKAINVIFQGPNDVAVLNADNVWTKRIGTQVDERTGTRLQGRIVWFGNAVPEGAGGTYVKDEKFVVRKGGAEEVVCPVSDLAVSGAHNVMNALAVIGAASAVGIPAETIARGIRAFKGVPDRQEIVAVHDGVTWVNDTTATSPDASIVALQTFGDLAKRKVILITGGADKKLEFEEWAKVVAKYAKHLVLFDGTATPRIEQALKDAGSTVPMIGARNMDEAVRLCAEYASAGDVVLLSPGCASFGVFLNEFDRSEQFVRAVRKLTKGVSKPRK